MYQAPSLEPREGHLSRISSTHILQSDTGGERKVSASRHSLTLKGGKQQGHSWVTEGLKIDSILGICIQWCESCVRCSAYLCLTFTTARLVFIVSTTGEQAPGFFYCQRQGNAYSPRGRLLSCSASIMVFASSSLDFNTAWTPKFKRQLCAWSLICVRAQIR